jgi:acetyltransferase-like isoleucine patch superfamily enzyme
MIIIKKLLVLIWEPLNLVVSYLYLRAHGVETKFGYVRLYGFPMIRKHPGSRIILGNRVQLISISRFNVAGINHPVILATLSAEAKLEMCQNSGASGATITAVKSILISSYAQIGANASIYDTDFHCIHSEKRKMQKNVTEAKSAPIVIGENAWIGANAMILKGVRIGNNSIVGAGAVVTKDIVENTIVAGNPAKVVRSLK